MKNLEEQIKESRRRILLLAGVEPPVTDTTSPTAMALFGKNAGTMPAWTPIAMGIGVGMCLSNPQARKYLVKLAIDSLLVRATSS